MSNATVDKQPRFTLARSPHGMMCVSMTDPTREERWFWLRALRANRREDRFYTQRQKVHPFLQSDHPDYILIEFWTSDEKAVKAYIAWCNSVFDAEVERAREYI